MNAPSTPYTAALGDREPLQSVRETTERILAVVARLSDAALDRPLAPGKWSPRQILVHLAQSELALGFRARMALASPNYTSQNFDQDAWMAREGALTGREAAAAFAALARMNAGLFAGLTPQERATVLTHPEFGAISVDWILHQLAGHQRHHLDQLERVDA